MHEAFPEAWKVVRDYLDEALCEHCEKLLGQGIDRDSILQTNYKLCAIFLPQPALLDRVVAATRAGRDPDPGDLRTVLRASGFLSTVFAELALKMDFTEYVHRIKTSLKDLEHNNFDIDEVQNLRGILQAEAQKLVDAGIRSFDKKIAKVDFFDGTVNCVLQTPFDEFTFRFHAQVISIGTNTSALPLLPWEALFYKPGDIPGVPAATALPPELLVEHRNVRQAVRKALGSDRLTLSQMRKEVGSRLKGFLALSRTFALEWEFLNTVAQRKAAGQLHAHTLRALPAEEERATVKQAIASIQDLRKTDLLFAAGPDLQNDVDGILALLGGIQDGVGPTARQLQVYSSFFKMCLKKMENFVTTTVETHLSSKQGQLTLPSKKQLFGLKALQAIMDRTKEDIAAGETKKLKDFQVFRTFDWVLTQEMRDITSKWIQEAIQFDMKCPSRALQDKATEEEGGACPRFSKSSSSSAGAEPLSKPLPLVIASQAAPVALRKPAQPPACNVMSFFSAKPK